MNGTITNLNLTVSRLSHEFTTDLHMLLVGPSGTSVVFLSHAGGGNLISNVTFTVSDSAAFPFDPSFPIWSEIFRPTAYSPSISFPAPAPAGPYSTSAFSNYFGLSPNGPWSLFVFDDQAPDQGSIGGGWSLMIATSGANQPPTITDVNDQSTAVNTPTPAIPVTVGDVEAAAGSLTLSGSSSNTGLVPDGNIVFAGMGANRTVTVAPASDQTGTATITLTVSDGSLSASDTFVLTVLP